MRNTIVPLCLAVFAVLSGCSRQALQPCETAQTAQTLHRDVTLQLDYLLYLPADYASSQKDWPLLIFLHGLGERGPDLNKVKIHGPAKLIEQGREFPFIVVSPQCPAGSWWPYETQKVLALIDEIVETCRVDEKRIYLTGLSMGGFGTWAIASVQPQRFAAIAPVCGGGCTFLAPRLTMPIRAFHGDADTVVPLEKSREMVDAVNNAGGNATLTVYPGVGHNSWTQTYANNELYEWLLSHSK